MKKYITIIFLLFICLNINAQAPQGFNYQATVRNSSGDLVMNQNVYLKFKILQGSQTSVSSYEEVHSLLTDDLGHVSLLIGQGDATTGIFSELDWSLGNYFLSIEIDTGNGFVAMGTTQFFSVPYALYSESSGSSENSSLPNGTSNGDTLEWNASTSSWDINSSNNTFDIKTLQIDYYSNNSGRSGGEVISDGGSSVTARGIVWGVNPDPMIDGDKTTDGTGSGTFISELTNLSESTTYYYRAYATNSNRTVYGTTYSFQTMSSSDDNDGDGFTVADGDCNDLDFNINPSAFEIQDDGIDQNCDGTDSLSPVYLSSNGITIKAHSWASFGDVGSINGKDYVIVDRETLKSMVAQNMDYSAVCTSLITDMTDIFNNRTKNYSISSWDVGNVTNMAGMFSYCNLGVDHELNLWDVSKVVDMSGMFERSNFNGYIYAWDTSSVTQMTRMFQSATAMNQSIANWNTSSVADMSFMFYNANNFNQPVGDWDVSSVTTMSYMFYSTGNFNQPIANWNTSSVADMSYMFYNANNFNQPVGDWDVSSVNFMNNMFLSANAFNQSLNDWDVSSVSNMYQMFAGATAFNGDISSWDVSNVNNMAGMFYNATAFNQNISNWCVTNITSEPSQFSFNSSLSESNKPVWGTCD
jgi:surface protein